MENLSHYKFNPIRIEYIKNNIIKEFNIKNRKKPFSGLEIWILDVVEFYLPNLCTGLEEN